MLVVAGAMAAAAAALFLSASDDVLQSHAFSSASITLILIEPEEGDGAARDAIRGMEKEFGDTVQLFTTTPTTAPGRTEHYVEDSPFGPPFFVLLPFRGKSKPRFLTPEGLAEDHGGLHAGLRSALGAELRERDRRSWKEYQCAELTAEDARRARQAGLHVLLLVEPTQAERTECTRLGAAMDTEPEVIVGTLQGGGVTVDTQVAWSQEGGEWESFRGEVLVDALEDFIRMRIRRPADLGDIVRLSPTELKREVEGGGVVLAVFTMRGCYHCKKLTPTWREVAAVFSKQSGGVTVGSVDLGRYGEDASRYLDGGAPTIRLFVRKDLRGTVFKGTRTADAIIKWVRRVAK
eukprot:Hpha_TRINITY_DN16183_c1_g9::TRINITY_DN16183_c1_g9_i1::g.9026::m.9026/K09584/PDIA6, TXNDC7; protein disulfide-isomerase A6